LVGTLTSVELFAGAGGMGLGLQRGGFSPALTVEWDRFACETLRSNRDSDTALLSGWNIKESDVRDIDWSDFAGVDLVSGGPPCQPFSISGRARASDDPRDMFPATAEVIRRVRPRAFIFENVRGLTRLSFANYFEYIQLRLSFPQICRRDNETWTDHLGRLQRQQTSARNRGQDSYSIVSTVVNAADYGVPQQRYRVFMVGFRDDVDAKWSFPTPTHSSASLFRDQAQGGAYWDRHKISARRRRSSQEIIQPEMDRASIPDGSDELLPWLTVRDALLDLPDPTRPSRRVVANHIFQPGARAYKGHDGSALDLPSKTLKAGSHGVPGGENMMRLDDGGVRYFTVRESARLQTFPDDYELRGSWEAAMKQLGNAVPIDLARSVAASVAPHLS
jgi:DNA (cytosine-5)-methyltransferase 1